MSDAALHLLGLARKGRRIEVGEEPVGGACRARKCKLLILAADAADNTVRRAEHFAEAAAIRHHGPLAHFLRKGQIPHDHNGLFQNRTAAGP